MQFSTEPAMSQIPGPGRPWPTDATGSQHGPCLVVDKLAAADKLLAARGLKPEQEEVLEMQLANKPGALGDVAKTLGDAGVNIKYVFVGADRGRKATIFLAVSDIAAALKALR